MNRAERRAASRSGSPAPVTVPKVVIGVIHPGEVSMACMVSIMCFELVGFYLRSIGVTQIYSQWP